MSRERALELLDALAAAGVRPLGVCADSREARAGDLFLAWPGARSDGRDHVADALARGVSAVLWESGDGHAPTDCAVPAIGVEDLRAVAGHLAHELFGRPSQALWVAGVTGTNGKTTVSQWIAQALEALEVRCGVVGTLGTGFPGHLEPLANTTPDAIVLHRALAALRGAGARAVSMEVSSIGLDQARVAGVEFDVAVFTNLSRDHLEYHGTMDAYAQAKARLFDKPTLSCAVINVDDPFGAELAAKLATRGARVICCTMHETTMPDLPRLIGKPLGVAPSGIRFTVCEGREHAEVALATVGGFNVANALAVIGVLRARGVPLAEAAQATSGVVPPPGRMQLFGGVGEPLVVVDYAHTPDALAKVLEAARDAATRRGGSLACVFGCGGERDPGKRALMGEAAAALADRVIVTSDNPRGEDPAAIAAMVLEGTGGGAHCELDRTQAIRLALAQAHGDDVVVVAGKGHESWQEIAGVRHPYCDAAAVRAALGARALQRETTR